MGTHHLRMGLMCLAVFLAGCSADSRPTVPEELKSRPGAPIPPEVEGRPDEALDAARPRGRSWLGKVREMREDRGRP